jgi:tetrahedral aminopeptidase
MLPPTSRSSIVIMRGMNLPLLKELSEAAGVSGREERIRAIVQKAATGLFDTTTTDPMGSLICHKKKANAKRLVLACHMDEIGFYVRHVDDKGFIRIQNAGGFDTRNLLARRVMVQTSFGGDVVGIMNPGGRPIHIAKDEDKKKIPEISDFVVDLCMPAAKVKKMVRIGDPVTLVQEFSELGDCVTGKCLDNRVAPFVAIEAVKKAKKHRFDLVVAMTVQEEVGLRGAITAGYASEGDLGLGIDTTLCCDGPGVPEDERVTQQGAGVALTIMDGSSISDRGLIDELDKLATKKKIPHQLSILPRGGTDAAALQRARGGMRAATFSIPTRNIHTVTECVHKRDLQSAIDLLAAFLEG